MIACAFCHTPPLGVVPFRRYEYTEAGGRRFRVTLCDYCVEAISRVVQSIRSLGDSEEIQGELFQTEEKEPCHFTQSNSATTAGS